MSYVTGISGNVISAASAGFAPTNSADVSAIASSYAESAASSKLDESASSNFYTTANESGFLTSIPNSLYVANITASGHVQATGTGDLRGNFDYAGMYFRSGANRPYNIGIDNTGSNFYIATAKNGYERIYASSIQSWNAKLDSSASSSFYTTANESGFVDSAYVDSAVSSKLDTTAYNSGDFYTTSNPSSFVDSAYVDSAVSGKADSSALSSYALSSDVSGVIDTVSSNSASWGGGGATGDYVETSATEVTIGSANTAGVTSLALGVKNRANFCSFAQGSKNSATSDSFAQGDTNSAKDGSFAQGYYNSANIYSVAQGFCNSAIDIAAVFGKYNLRGNGDASTGDSAAFAIGDGTAGTARHDLMLVTKDGEITMYSSTADTVGTGIMSSIRAISAAATGGGGVDSATVSAIASSYAESAASSKMDSSAIDYTRTGNGTQIYASGTGSSTNQFSAKNDSAGAAIIAGENARLRLWDTAATANLYASSIGGWNAAANLVSSQSANWGGSALQLSAGAGISLTMVGNTLVISTAGV